MESETNFQQTGGKLPNAAGFMRNNSIKNSNSQQRQQQQQQFQQRSKSYNTRRRASDCSFYGGGGGEPGDNLSYYGMPLDNGQKRGSLNGVASTRLRKSPSNKSSVSASSGDVSCHSGSSTCSGDDTSTSSGQPNLPFPGFVEYSFRYLNQESWPRSWCLQLITNP